MTRWRRVAFAAVAAAVFVAASGRGGIAASGRGVVAADAASDAVTAAVVVKPAAEATMAANVTGFGTVIPDPNAVLSLNAPFAATVGQVFVRAGGSVAKGEKLVALDTAPAQAAAFAQAQAAVTYAQGELDRTQRMLRQQLATHAQVAQAQTALADAQARLRALQSIGAGQATTVMTAPAAGIVSAVTAIAGKRLTEGAGILTLVPRSAMMVRLGVAPERADALRPGMAVRLRDVLDPEQALSGKVASVSAVIEPRTRLRDVLVSIDSDPAALDPPPVAGTFMQGTIALRSTRALAVPRDAILLDGQGTYLFVVRHGEAYRVDVTAGLAAGGLVGVTGGIHAGDQVVVQGNYELTDGMHVREVGQ